jgi:hypothetical protein
VAGVVLGIVDGGVCLIVCYLPARNVGIAKGMFAFFLVDVGMLMLVTFVPFITLWLPHLVFG